MVAKKNWAYNEPAYLFWVTLFSEYVAEIHETLISSSREAKRLWKRSWVGRPLKLCTVCYKAKKQLSVLQPVLVRGKCPFWSCLFCEGQNIMFWEIKTDWVNKCKQINESISQTMKQSVIQMINQSMKLLFFSPNLWCRATGNVQPAATAATRKRKTHICWIVIYRVDSVIQSLNNQALGNKQVSLKWKLSCLSPVRS